MGLLSSFGIIRRRKKNKENSTTIAAVVTTGDDDDDADDDDDDADSGPVFVVETTNTLVAEKKKKNRRSHNNNNNNNSSSSPFTWLHNDDASVCTTTTKNNNKYFPFKRNKKKKRKRKRKRKRKKTKNKNNKHTNTHAATTARKATATVVTLDHVPDLILDLETAVIVNAKRPMRALQMLFKLSSSGSSSSSSSRSGGGGGGGGDGSISISINNTRIGMVHNQKIDNNDGNDNDGYRYGQRLVVTLLKYIKRCSPQSDEHNLALIVLNNISIPPENKKTIALDCNGIEILSKLLCEDPSCHLIAIVLVNLTYDFGRSNGGSGSGSGDSSSSSSLRNQLLDCNDKTSLIESLAFALRVSSLTPNEYKARQTTIDDCNYSDDEYLSPVIRLSILMAKDQQLRSHQQQQQQQPSTKEEILLQLQSDEEELHQLDKLVLSSVKMDRSRDRGGKTTHYRSRTSSYYDPPPPPQPSLSPSSIIMKEDEEEEEEKLNDSEHNYLYPETTKWCLYALRNLSQPLSLSSSSASASASASVCNNSDDLTTTSIVANILIKSGIYSLILQQFVNTSVVPPSSSQSTTLHVLIAHTSSSESITTASSSSSSNTTLTNIDNNKNEPNSNSNTNTNSKNNSKNNNLVLLLQDTAVSIILNLSACAKSREYMNEPETIKVLTTKCDNDVMSFQRLKARMALSYLIGSQGHYGQPKLRSIASTVQANRKNSVLILSSHTEVDLLLELLVNALYHRGKDNNNSGGGGGGYLVGAFNLKCVLFSLRCLLTHTTNQETIAKSIGLDLNTILMNILAQYAFDEEEDGRSIIDSDSAEHIVFCLYLQSNYGFADFVDQEMSSFLPHMYAPPPSRTLDDVDHGLAANILITYLRRSENNNNADVKTSAGCHAAKELLLRLKYMNFRNHKTFCRKTYRVSLEDLTINYILLAKIKRVRIPDRKHGMEPNPMIFHHSVLRYQKSLSTESGRMPLWNNYNSAAVSNFSNVLLAVQQLSYGSIKVRRNNHQRSSFEPIDDIAIANKIVYCANNQMEVCYNFMWAWEDFKIKDTHEIEDEVEVEDDIIHEPNKSKDTAERIFGCVEGMDSPIPNKSWTTQNPPLGPMSFYGMFCCAMDHSINGGDDDDTNTIHQMK